MLSAHRLYILVKMVYASNSRMVSFIGVCGDSEGGVIPLVNDVNCLNDVRMWWCGRERWVAMCS